MGRKSDARERIVSAGADLLGRRAYNSIGVAEICSEAGVPKGSFYYFFPSKQALVLEVVDQHWVWQRQAWSEILGADEPLVERLRKLFDAAAEMQSDALRGTGSVSGCLFGNLALEAAAEDAPVRERIQQIFGEQLDMLEEVIAEAAPREGLEIADPRATAKAIVAQLEGLVLFAKLYDDPAQLDELWANSQRLLGIRPSAAASA